MIGETVTRLRAPFKAERDRYGNRLRDWENAAALDLAGCAVAPRGFTGTSREEDSNGRQGVLAGLTVYAPPGADVVASDRVRARGEVYEVDGEPGVWISPHDRLDGGVEIALRRVEG